MAFPRHPTGSKPGRRTTEGNQNRSSRTEGSGAEVNGPEVNQECRFASTSPILRPAPPPSRNPHRPSPRASLSTLCLRRNPRSRRPDPSAWHPPSTARVICRPGVAAVTKNSTPPTCSTSSTSWRATAAGPACARSSGSPSSSTWWWPGTCSTGPNTSTTSASSTRR